MRVIVSLAALIALLAIGVSATEMSLKTTVAPRIAGSSDVCNKETCPPEDGSCDWCPDYGPFCNSPGWSCCGCADSWCWSCRSISSCATWVPNGGWECPDSSNGNSTRWGSCYWVRNIDMKSNWSVLRCNSVDRTASVKIKWDVTYKPGTFYVSIFDKANFFNFRENKPYTCLNKNCGNNGPSPHQYGSMVASGSTDYYVITMGFTAGNYQIVASVE